MSEAEKRELQELIDLLCKGQASQYDRRCLLNYIDKLQTKYEKQKKINLEQNQFIDTLKTNIIKLQKENEELKSKKQLGIDTSEEVLKWKGKYHLLSRENQELKEKIENEIKELEENEDFYREHNRMYEYEGKINLLKKLLAKE